MGDQQRTTPQSESLPDDEDFDDLCGVCGGEGWMMACDGDGGDWGEDIYTGPMDATMTCRHCNGTGLRK